jgi:hypothetical protein
MPDRDPDVRIAIEHSIKVLGRWTAGLYLVVAAILVAFIIWGSVQRQELRTIQDDTVTALCTFTHDLEQRYDNGVEFLEKHPDGIPGISAADIERSLHNQKETLDSLSGLPCPKPQKPKGFGLSDVGGAG